VTTRHDRIKMQRRMQRRIRLVVEERRIAHAFRPAPAADVESTVELPPRVVGRVPVESR
jgi:hypothetical protein